MNFYEQEMRKMFENKQSITDKVFVGKTMIAKLDDSKILKLEFTTSIEANKYTAIMVSIINRNEGVVDRETIKFSDVIGMYKRGNGYDEICPHMWEYRGEAEWYTKISNPQKEEIANKVMEYASMYQDVGIGHRNMFL